MISTNKKDGIKNKYERLAPRYDLSMSFLEKAVIEKLRRQLLSQAKGNVLEVAVGTGKSFDYYPTDVQLTGIDISPAMLTVARNRADKAGKQVELLVMDSEKLEFVDHAFDTVVSSLSLCTYTDPTAVLKEMQRVCQPDGLILLLEHGISNTTLMAKIQKLLSPSYARFIGCHWDRDPIQLLDEAGLKISSQTRTTLGIFYAITAKPS